MKTKNVILATASIFIALSSFFYTSCKKSSDGNDNSAPPGLANVNIENLPGGVKVGYDDLTDLNVMLVSAEYETAEGGKEIRRFDLSDSRSGFVLMGLQTTTRELVLYTVSHTGISSDRITVDIAPELSPTYMYLQDVLASIDFVGIPTGVAFSVNNPDLKDLKYLIEVKEESSGQWIEYATETSSEDNGFYPYRDFLHTEARITVMYQDEDESTNPKVFAVNALIEEELNKDTWSKVELETDNWRGNYAGIPYAMESLWDRQLGTVTSPRFENKNEPLPHSFTIDLGANQELSLSKIKIYHFANNLGNTYGQYNPRTIEIYGSNNPGDDGGWTNWEKIATCISEKPSGASAPTTADLNYLRAGEEYTFPLFTPAFRYLRFKVINTWTKNEGESTFIRLSEVALFGVEQ